MIMMLRYPLILVFTLRICVVCDDSCAQKDVSGAIGGDVILRVQQKEIKIIYWLLANAIIAQTKPGEPIDDTSAPPEYMGRMSGETDGSLYISKLSQQDQRMYTADIRPTGGGRTCVMFNLTIYERLSPGDIQISHTITSNDTCSLAVFCTVERRDVTITWSGVPSSDINVTRGVLYIPPSGVSDTYICTAHNPVSNVSKDVNPEEYCKKEADPTGGNRLHLFLVVFAVFFGIAFGLCKLFYYKKRKRCLRGSETPNAGTTYAQVGGNERQVENPYHQPQEEKQDLASVYSTVQHVKKKNPQNKENEKEKIQVETVYSEVGPPKGNQSNGTGARIAGPSNQSNVTHVKV